MIRPPKPNRPTQALPSPSIAKETKPAYPGSSPATAQSPHAPQAAAPKPGDPIPAPLGLHPSMQGYSFIQAGPGAKLPVQRNKDLPSLPAPSKEPQAASSAATRSHQPQNRLPLSRGVADFFSRLFSKTPDRASDTSGALPLSNRDSNLSAHSIPIYLGSDFSEPFKSAGTRSSFPASISSSPSSLHRRSADEVLGIPDFPPHRESMAKPANHGPDTQLHDVKIRLAENESRLQGLLEQHDRFNQEAASNPQAKGKGREGASPHSAAIHQIVEENLNLQAAVKILENCS